MKTASVTLLLVAAGAAAFYAFVLREPPAPQKSLPQQNPGGTAAKAPPRDPGGELLKALQHSEDSVSDITGLLAGLSKASPSELESLYAQLLQLPASAGRNTALLAVIRNIAAADPQRAHALAAQIDQPKLAHDALMEVLTQWGTRDVNGAWAYLSKLPPEEFARQPIRGLLTGAAEKGDLNETLTFIRDNFKVLAVKDAEALKAAFHHLYDARGAEEVRKFVEQLPPGEAKSTAVMNLIDRWAKTDPQKALEWMQKNVAAEDLHNANLELVQSWIQVEPKAAVAYINKLDQASPDYYTTAFKSWYLYDKAAAAEWLRASQPSPMLDGAYEGYARMIAAKSPGDALNWAASITDEEKKLNLMSRIGMEWQRKDAPGLEKFIRDNQMEDLAAKIRDRMK
jgi:hypothetical protein